jgi:hypothetical protein
MSHDSIFGEETPDAAAAVQRTAGRKPATGLFGATCEAAQAACRTAALPDAAALFGRVQSAARASFTAAT